MVSTSSALRLIAPKAASDGYDAWATISSNAQSPRNVIVHNIFQDVEAGIRVGDMKLLYNAGAWKRCSICFFI
jgi:hypothetical protein